MIYLACFHKLSTSGLIDSFSTTLLNNTFLYGSIWLLLSRLQKKTMKYFFDNLLLDQLSHPVESLKFDVLELLVK